MQNTLKRKDCRLVQAATFRDNITEITGRNSIIILKYMYASDFEWGARPRSTQRMLTNIEFYNFFTFPQYVNNQGEPLIVYAPTMFIEHISKIVEELATGKCYLKEICTLPEHLNGEKPKHRENFWWDIDNDFYIFFGEEKRDLVLKAEKEMRRRSLGEVEVGDWDELSEYYSTENPDLNEEAQEFLKPKKSVLIKRLVKTLSKKVEQDTNI